MSIVYNKTHTIEINGYNTWTDWHLVPVSRPYIALAEPNIHTVQIAGTSKFVDLTDVLPGGLTFGQRTGSWEFYIDYDYWPDWSYAYNTIADSVHGRTITVRLADDPTRQYNGRVTVAYSTGEDHSRIVLNYSLYPTYEINTDPFNEPSDSYSSFSGNWNYIRSGYVYVNFNNGGYINSRRYYYVTGSTKSGPYSVNTSYPLIIKVNSSAKNFALAYSQYSDLDISTAYKKLINLNKGTTTLSFVSSDAPNSGEVYFWLVYVDEPDGEPKATSYSFYYKQDDSNSGYAQWQELPEPYVPPIDPFDPNEN